MKLLLVALAFLQIGLVAFGGGYASLPLIQQIIVTKNNWLTSLQFVDVITISQMTPGPIAINAATFVGTKIAGIQGAILATLANVLPQTILMIVFANLLFKGKKLTFMDNILKGLRPGVVGLIAAATIDMFFTSVIPFANISNIDYLAAISFVIGLILYWKKVDMLLLILLGAIIGVTLFHFGIFI